MTNYLKIIKRDCLFYFELNNFFFSCFLGSVKFSLPSFYKYICSNNYLIIKKKVLITYNKTIIIRLIFFLSELLRSNSYGSLGKFKIIGLGYKLLLGNNQLVFKLGYSHLLYTHISLSIYIKKKKKKRKFVSLGQILNYKINSLVNKIESYRVPDIYCGNGIFNRKKVMTFKKKNTLLF